MNYYYTGLSKLSTPCGKEVIHTPVEKLGGFLPPAP